MNKDMINIDDFVRDKLGGHTEKEDPAAWLRMKALLDKEMPEKAAPLVFGWRKPMAFLGAALLIGALCVGGYQLSATREKSHDHITHTPAYKPEHNSTNTTGASDLHTSPTELLTAPDAPSPERPDATDPLSENNTNNTVNGGTTAAATNTLAESRSAAPARAPRTDAGSANNAAAAGAETQQPSAAPSAGRSNSTGAAGVKSRLPGSAATATQTSRNQRNSAILKQEPAGTRRKVSNALAANTPNHRKDEAAGAGNTATAHSNSNTGRQDASEPAKKSAAKIAPKVLNSASSGSSGKHRDLATKNKKDSAGRLAKAGRPADERVQEPAQHKEAVSTKETAVNHNEEPKDSISAITVVTRESTSRGGYPKKITRITDTIAITKVPVVQVNNTIVSSVQPSKKEMKLAAAESRKANKLSSKKQATQQQNVYASAAKVTVKENAGKAAAPAQGEAIVKVKKEKSAFTQWWQNLPEAMADAKRDFNSAQFYWGISGGVNYSFPKGSGGFQGVQFGPTGELVFNKHWSLFGAIKYFNRSGSKKIVNDNFSSQIAEQDSVRGANWYFTARTDSTNRYFNFSTVHSFEMPITLRYTIRKFYVMTGINLAYYLPVNVEKVEREYNNMNVHVITTNSSKVILNEPTKPQLNISDFGSRFGMGYVIGAGYQITPAWQTDIRIVNPFWDNAKGAGAQKLSKDFYKLPSVQLSFGYQINRIRNRATFGPNSAP